MSVQFHAGLLAFALLVLAAAAVPLSRAQRGPIIVYGAAAVIAGMAALSALIAAGRHELRVLAMPASYIISPWRRSGRWRSRLRSARSPAAL